MHIDGFPGSFVLGSERWRQVWYGSNPDDEVSEYEVDEYYQSFPAAPFSSTLPAWYIENQANAQQQAGVWLDAPIDKNAQSWAVTPSDGTSSDWSLTSQYISPRYYRFEVNAYRYTLFYAFEIEDSRAALGVIPCVALLLLLALLLLVVISSASSVVSSSTSNSGGGGRLE